MKTSFLRKIINIISALAIVSQSLTPYAVLLPQTASAQETVTETPAPDQTTVTETPTPAPDQTTVTPTETETPTPTDTPTDTVTPEPINQVVPTDSPTVDNNSPPSDNSSNSNLSNSGLSGTDVTPTTSPSITIDPNQDGLTSTSATTQSSTGDEQLSLVILDNVSAPTVDLGAVVESGSAALTTDKPDYAPTDTALITGTNLLPNTTYSLHIWSSNTPATSTTVDVISGDLGAFAYAYQLDGTYRPNYSAELKDSEGNVVATTEFTDSTSTTVAGACMTTDYNGGGLQCTANDTELSAASAPVIIGDGATYNDALGSNNGLGCQYPGDYVKFSTTWNIATNATQRYNLGLWFATAGQTNVTDGGQCSITSLPDNPTPFFEDSGDSCGDMNSTGTGTVHVTMVAVCNPDNNGLLKLPYCTSWSQNDHNACTNPTQTLPGTGSKCSCNSGSTIPVNIPPGIEVIKNLVPTIDPGLFNLQINSVTKKTDATNGDTTGKVGISTGSNTFGEANGTNTDLNNYTYAASCVLRGTQTSVTTNKSGTTWTIPNVTNGQDIVCTITNTRVNNASITIIKDAQPNDAQDFAFTTTGSGLSSFSLDDDSDNTLSNTKVFSNLALGTYSVSEGGVSGWTQSSATCTDGSPVSAINLSAGENVTCTFVNTRDTGSVELKKHWIGTAGSTTLNIGTSAGGSQTDTQSVSGSDNTTGTNIVNTGTYYVSETGGLTNYNSSLSCTKNGDSYSPGGSNSVVINKGDVVICTFTNTRKQGSIELKKHWIGTAGSTTLNIGTSISGNEVDTQSINGADGTTGTNSVDTGTYYLSENGGLTNYSTSISCTKNGQAYDPNANDAVSVDYQDVVICTYANTRNQGTIELKKIWSGTPGQTTLQIGTSAGGTQVISTPTGANGGNPLTTGTKTVNTGTYYVSETGGLTDYDSILVCLNNGDPVVPGENNSLSVTTGHAIVCTFTNTRQQGTIELKKIWSGTPGQTTLNIGTQANGNEVDHQLTGANGAAPLTTEANTVDTGTYYLSENGGLTNYDKSPLSCVDDNGPVTVGTNNYVNVIKAQHVVCTFTNTRQTGTLRVLKNVDLNGDGDYTDAGETGATDWKWQANPGTEHNTGDSAITVNTGSYQLSETQKTGFHFVSLSCQGDNDSLDTSTNTVTVGNGSSVVCTFTNALNKGTLTVHKVTTPDTDTTTEFSITASGTGTILTPVATQPITGGSSVTYTVTPGTYDVAEDALTGWSEKTSGCQGVEVASGQDAECTIYNSKLPTLTIYKVCNPVGDTGTFNLQIDGENVTTGTICGGWTNGPIIVDAGTHTVSEGGGNLSAYTSVISGDCNPENGQVELGFGENKSCTITNTRKGNVIVTKFLDDNANGVKDASEGGLESWTMNLSSNGSKITDVDGNSTFTNVVPGTYSLSETGQQGWNLSNIYCGNEEGIDNDNSHSVTVSAGQTTHCYVGNYQNSTIIVNKVLYQPDGQTVASGDNTTFDFNITNHNNYNKNFGLSNGQSTDPDYSVKPGNYDVSEFTPSADYEFIDCSAEYENEAIGSPIAGGENVTVNSGDTVNVTCYNKQKSGTITGDKFNDIIGRGVECPFQIFDQAILDDEPTCQPKLSDWTINLYKNNDGDLGDLVKSTQTDENGYLFDNIIPGSYWVCEDLKNGWEQTYPNSENAKFFEGFGYCYPVTIKSNGESGENNFGNHNLIPILTISKSNDAVGDKAPGDVVTYTLTVTADETGGPAENVLVTDLLPEGFHYIHGSWTANSNFNGVLSLSEPTYASPGVWTVGHMDPGEVITLTYQAQIDGNQATGIYPDNAWAQGTPISDSSNVILALAVDPGQLDSTFVGTQVSVVAPNDISAGFKANTSQDVLGASTYLPATGENTLWVIIATLLGLSGLGALAFGLKLKKRYE